MVHEAQFADVWFEPDPAAEEGRLRLGWLGKMSEAACIFEPFSSLPGLDEVRECLRKLLGKHHHRSMEAKKRKQKMPEMPRLWIIAPAMPEAVQKDFGFYVSDVWPPGIWLSPNGIQLGWVALSELPQNRETLMLRMILVRGAVYEQACRELEALPEDAWEKWTANRFLFARMQKLIEDRENERRALSDEEKEFVMNSQQIYEMKVKELLERGRQMEREAAEKRMAMLEQQMLEKARQEREAAEQQMLEKARQEREAAEQQMLEKARQEREVAEQRVLEKVRQESEAAVQQMLEKARQEREDAMRSVLAHIYLSRFGYVPAPIVHALEMEHSPERLLSWSAVFSMGSQQEIDRSLAITAR